MNRTITSLSKLAVAALSMAGCAANPATGVAANGDPLRVQYATGTGTYTSNDVVGTDVHSDADGNVVGQTDHYQAVEHSFQWNDWKFFQGAAELDEQDYYRLAGDRDAVDHIAQIRDSAATKQKIGVPVMVAGLAVALAANLMSSANGASSLTTTGYVAGSTLATVGGLVWYWGHEDMSKRHHMAAARAEQDADVIENCAEGHGCTRDRGGRASRTRGASR
jgi:hypothetical protein